MKLLPILLGSAVAQSQNDILDMKKRSFLQEIELDAILQLQVKNLSFEKLIGQECLHSIVVLLYSLV